MAYITNDGARLIERARTEGKSLVFGSVRMNTIYKSDPTSLVQQTDEWFGESHGSVVGCISHVSVDEGSKVCDSKLAVQCNDNGESWKSLGIYARLDGEEGEVLFACESIENGEYKDVTIVEIPVTLAGVVEDFGLSEGGSGGGGGEAPANMMTTNTDQNDLTGTKTWMWDNYIGEGTVDNPHEGDIQANELFRINNKGTGNHAPIVMESMRYQYSANEGWHPTAGCHLEITSEKVHFHDSSASWSNIINAANSGSGGGGGGEVPANMMTTDTVQNDLTGTKEWTWESYEGKGTVDAPQDGDIRARESFSINYMSDRHIPLVLNRDTYRYSTKDGWRDSRYSHLQITSDTVLLNNSFASWSDIINAANVEQGFDHALIASDKGSLVIGDTLIKPNSEIKIGLYVMVVIDSNSKIASVRSSGSVLDVSVAVFASGSVHRVSGIVNDTAGLSFDAPITPEAGQEIYIHWNRYANNI